MGRCVDESGSHRRFGKHLKVATPTIENIIHLASLMNRPITGPKDGLLKDGACRFDRSEIRRLAEGGVR